ncbi:hypothetical protein HDV06_001605 [Boothiomyces sp. JEL0866]|nr:hypothetical protein HDV06_001605 [Boothiomyces sp. JEL0866]
MDKLMDSLSKQEDLQDTLVQTQLQTLYLKQQELQALAEKLAQLENTQMTQEQANQIQQETLRMKQKLEFFNRESSATLQIDEEEHLEGTITTAGAEQEMEEDAILEQLLNDTVVREKLEQLRQQSLELNYLEDQLANLKLLKQKMKEKQEILSKVSEDNIEESLKKLSHDNIETELERSEQAFQEFQSLKQDHHHQEELNNEHQELLDLINAMSKHLETLEEQQNELQNEVEKSEEKEEPTPRKNNKDSAAIENLITRLFEASVKESDDQTTIHPAMELEEGEIVEEVDSKDEQDENKENTLEGTYLKIQFAIKQISNQIQEVKDSEKLIQTEKERSYYDLVLGKLESQLQELVEIKNKISFYQNILTEDEKFYIAQDDLRNAASEDIQHPPVAKEAWNEQHTQKPPLPTPTGKSDATVKAGTKSCCCKKNSTSSVETTSSVAENEIPKAPHSTPLPETLSTVPDEGILESSSTFVPVIDSSDNSSPNVVHEKIYHELFEFKSKLSKPASRAASVTTNTPETPRLRKYNYINQRLFAKHKDEIYRNAASVVAAFETKPHFILSLFKKLKVLANSESALQQIQLLVDELVEHLDDEEFDDESEEDFPPVKNDLKESPMNSQQTHIHLSNQTHIASLVIGQPHLTSFDEKIIKELTLHVNSIIYSQLTTPAYGHSVCDSDSALELIERYRPMLHATLVGYAGKEVLSNWLRMVKDINRFIDKVFDWESPENDYLNENPLEALNRVSELAQAI